MLGQKAQEADIGIVEMSVDEACKDTPEVETVFRSVKVPSGMVLKVSLRCAQVGGERGALVEAIRSSKHLLLAATLSSQDESTISDSFWICQEEEQMSTEELLGELRQAIAGQVEKMASIQAQMKKARPSLARSLSMASWDGSHPFSTRSTSTVFQADRFRSSCSLQSLDSISGVMKDMTAEAEPEPELPIVLEWTRKEVEYPLQASTLGLTVDGFVKYVGMGLVQRSMKELLGSKAEADSKQFAPHILELRTFFVAERMDQASGQLAHLQHMLHDAVVGSPEYSHFVTWLDIANRTWTIDKVFLNDILPAGKGYGAKAVAEHLLAPLLFQRSEAYEASKLGRSMESLPSIEKLVVLDIVNWNTYMLMAVAGSTEEDARKKVGDVLDFALSAELQNSGLTQNQLSKVALVDVFKCTALGKMCGSVLNYWNKQLARQIRMESAQVVPSASYQKAVLFFRLLVRSSDTVFVPSSLAVKVFGQGDEEIFGQRRPRMAVIVKLVDATTRA